MLPDEAVSVSDFIDLLNETYDFAFPSLIVKGELLNLRISRGRWVYFDLKDDSSSLKCFGTVQQLPGPLENGILLEVRGAPRMHNLYGFSFNVQSIKPSGEGAIKRASELLAAKLKAEGLFDVSRKRPLPYPPQRIGLVTAVASAAYADFTKILAARWAGLDITVQDTLVQGEAAPAGIVAAIERFNQLADPPEVLVLIRGGGSADDLAAFSSELVTRAVAASRIPTLVAIGHEIDTSLAELAADKRASTPSNAAELLTPDKQFVLAELAAQRRQLGLDAHDLVGDLRQELQQLGQHITTATSRRLGQAQDQLAGFRQLLQALDPQLVLRRGYAVVRNGQGKLVSSILPAVGAAITVQATRATILATVTEVIKHKE